MTSSQLIERLAEGKHGVLDGVGVVLPHILIGDVLEKISNQEDNCGGLENKSEIENVIWMWEPLDFTSSLQELKDKPEAEHLFNFLKEILRK